MRSAACHYSTAYRRWIWRDGPLSARRRVHDLQHCRHLDQRTRARLAQRAVEGKEARDELVLANLRLVVHVAAKTSHSMQLELGDLIQHGNVGLLQAVDRYDWRRGHRFSTYATWTIRHAILRGVAAEERSPRLPYALQRAVVKATAARARLEAETGVTPSVDALADATALDLRMVRDAMTAQVTTLSLDEPTANGTTIGQFLAAQSLPVEDLVIDALHDAHVLRQARELLDAEDWRLLCLRFGLDGAAQRSNALVAAAVDLSVETVRRRIVAALERLRAVLA
jgi:RNA polymerase primary sigma factor